MEPEFWHERWERGQIGFHQKEVNRHLHEHWQRLIIPPDSQVLVPLCGKTLDILWLSQQGYHVVGVELSELAIGAFFRENNLEPKIIPGRDKNWPGQVWSWSGPGAGDIQIFHGDFFNLPAAQTGELAAVYDRASIVALPPKTREKYARKLRETLPNRPPVLLLTFEYDQSKFSGPPFSVPEREVRGLFADTWRVETVLDQELIDTSPRWRERGMTSFRERVYVLRSGGG